jgi:hypothetical protein
MREWFGVLGAPLAWAGQLTFGSQVEELACGRGLSVMADREAVLVAIGGAALAVAVLASVAAFRSVAASDGDDVQPFLARSGVFLSLVFGVLIAMGVVQVLVNDPCAIP